MRPSCRNRHCTRPTEFQDQHVRRAKRGGWELVSWYACERGYHKAVTEPWSCDGSDTCEVRGCPEHEWSITRASSPKSPERGHGRDIRQERGLPAPADHLTMDSERSPVPLPPDADVDVPGDMSRFVCDLEDVVIVSWGGANG